MTDEAPVYDHVWFWRAKMPGRKGQPCRVLARGAKNTVLVEYDDGKKVSTSRHAVRYVPEDKRAAVAAAFDREAIAS